MINAEILKHCKVGLGIPESATSFDPVISQKALAVKSFMRGAGVSETLMENELAVGTLVMGVQDIWKLDGDINFSLAFNTMLGQLVSRSKVV